MSKFSPPPIPADSWCRTRYEDSVDHTFVWTIEQFSQRKVKVDEAIESAKFSVSRRVWINMLFSSSFYLLDGCCFFQIKTRGRIQRKTWCMGPYAVVDYNVTLCPLQSQLQHMYSTMGNSIPESTLTLCQSQLYPSVRDLGFGLWKNNKNITAKSSGNKRSKQFSYLAKLNNLSQHFFPGGRTRSTFVYFGSFQEAQVTSVKKNKDFLASA